MNKRPIKQSQEFDMELTLMERVLFTIVLLLAIACIFIVMCGAAGYLAYTMGWL